MSVIDDVEAGFKILAGLHAQGAKVTLGERAPVPCIIPDGVERSGEERPGRYRNSINITVACLKKDIGESPKTGEKAVVDFNGEQFELMVSPDMDVTEQGGAIYSFNLTSG
tara:strand:+ start:179 stop:511 length:333 start_codon:yes stop_codon:yes gene_type:complete